MKPSVSLVTDKPSKQSSDPKKKSTPEDTSTQVATKDYSEEDRARLKVMKAKVLGSQPPTFTKGKKDGHLVTVGDDLLNRAGLLESFGTASFDLVNLLLNQVRNISLWNSQEGFLNATLAVLHSLKPRDELEGLLITQMIGTHSLAMEFMRRATLPDQTVEGVNFNTDRATKMMRTFTSQLESLNRHRGKGHQQKVTVEHVTVNSGGQAIVGQVNPTHPRGEGIPNETSR
jgi:hypothetical protein